MRVSWRCESRPEKCAAHDPEFLFCHTPSKAEIDCVGLRELERGNDVTLENTS